MDTRVKCMTPNSRNFASYKIVVLNARKTYAKALFVLESKIVPEHSKVIKLSNMFNRSVIIRKANTAYTLNNIICKSKLVIL